MMRKMKKKVDFKLLNFTAYNQITLSQKDTVYFQIIKEESTKDNRYGNARLSWTKLSRIFERPKGSSKARLNKQFSKCNLDELTRYQKERFIELKLLRGELQRFGKHIDD